MSYEEVAKVINDSTAYEDFNRSKHDNYRLKDFDREWNHTCTKMSTVSIEEMQENAFEDSDHQEEIIEDISINIEEQVVAKLTEET